LAWLTFAADHPSERFHPGIAADFIAWPCRATIPSVEIRVLGPVDVVAERGVVDLPLQQRRLLGMLSTRPQATLPIDELLEALWGEQQPASRAKVVQIYISRLRHALGSTTAVRTTRDGYALDLDAVSIDAARFEQLLVEARQATASANPALARSLLRRGLSLWRGRAFGEFAYEDWARLEAERLEELRLAASEEWLAAELALGRHAEALSEIRRLADEHPWRERFQELAMLALYRCGQQSEALEAYAQTQKRLRDDLGLEPGPELRELQRRILQQDPQLASPAPSPEADDSLPTAADELVARELELQELEDILVQRRARLLVLTGSGGSGKTRLALEVARRTASSFANGATFVDLSSLRHSALVGDAIARAIRAAIRPDEDPIDRVAEVLRPQERLLVLDNVEQLRPTPVRIVELLMRAPHLVLLVTSRTALHLTGEHVYPVDPLPLEDAAALFCMRARAADTRFEPTAEDLVAIERICERLDGLPLAIELAATRIRALSPSELLERLGPHLQLLDTGPVDRPPRQQALRATLDWSIDLLTPEERRDFSGLSVFAGGWTLVGAEAVAETSVDTLTSLVDHSLVRHERSASTSRYTMLDTIREFAQEQLAADESERLSRRHAQFLVEIGEAADAAPVAGRDAAMQELLPELANFRAAIAWAINSDPELALRLAWVGTLFQLPTSELRSLLEQAIAVSGDEPTLSRARATHAAARFAGMAGATEHSRALWNQALALYQLLGETAGVARSLAGLGVAAMQDGDPVNARSLYARSLQLYQSLGDRDGEWIVTNNLGELEREAGDYALASQLLDAAVVIAEDSDDAEAAAMSLHGLGDLALAQGQTARAEELHRKAISIAAELPGGRRSLCMSLAALASIAGINGDVQRAGALWGSVETLEGQLDATIPQDFRDRYRRPLDKLKPGALDAATRHGRTLPLEEVVALALAPDIAGHSAA
jgi:predicted ATPase/DNA-binding SARP family transcriptional activator